MKNLLLLLSTLLACAPSFAADTKAPAAASSGQLREVTIEGVAHIQMKEDKPTFTPTVNPSGPVGDYLAQHLQVSNLPSPEERHGMNIPIFLPSQIGSDVVLSPWHQHLVVPPALSLNVTAPPRLNLAVWRLIITDDKGRVFRLIKGRNHLPERLIWDGLSNGGEPVQVGHPYAYSLSLLDRASVPYYISGKTVRFNSYVYEHSKVLLVGIVTDRLFEQGDSISENGKAVLREIHDWVRKYVSGDIAVEIRGLDADLAQRQADTLRKALEKSLHLADGKVVAHGYAVREDEYLRTEIKASR